MSNIPPKQHTIPAYVLPNDSEDLLVDSPSSSPPPPPPPSSLLILQCSLIRYLKVFFPNGQGKIPRSFVKFFSLLRKKTFKFRIKFSTSTGKKRTIFYRKKMDNFHQKPLLLEKSGQFSTGKKWTIFAKNHFYWKKVDNFLLEKSGQFSPKNGNFPPRFA